MPPPPPKRALPIHDPRIGLASDGRPLAEYFAAIVACSSDDAPRLAYADAIARDQPKRSLLIKCAIAWSRWTSGPMPPELRDLVDRTYAFQHGIPDGWGRYMEPYVRPSSDILLEGWNLLRGFVGRARTAPSVILDPSVRFFELAPIEHLELTNEGNVRGAIAIAARTQVVHLDLGGLDLGDDDMDLLAAEGVLTCCEHLDLRANRIGPRGIATLVSSRTIRAMKRVQLSNNPGDPHMQYSYDCHGTIADMFLPAPGQEAEDKYGRIEWLHPLD